LFILVALVLLSIPFTHTHIITTPTMKVAASALLIGAVAAAGIPQQQPLQAARESVLGAGMFAIP